MQPARDRFRSARLGSVSLANAIRGQDPDRLREPDNVAVELTRNAEVVDMLTDIAKFGDMGSHHDVSSINRCSSYHNRFADINLNGAFKRKKCQEVRLTKSIIIECASRSNLRPSFSASQVP